MAQKTSVGLRIIAIGKLFKVCALVVFGVLALTMASGGDPPEAFRHWMHALQIDAGGRIVHGVLSKITGVDAKKLAELGVGSFVYAALFAVEGVGLWLQKRWAEWFTIAITISFIPIEIHEIIKHVNAPKIIVLVLNVAALVYLGFRVRQEHKLGARINRLVEQVVRT
jgi:uncharacterized membrane protein (DUF2068 family)